MNQDQFQQLQHWYKARDVESGLRLVNDLLEENPNDPAALFFGGLFHMTAEKKGMALVMFEKSAALNPEQAETLNNMGACLYQTQHLDLAMDLYNKAHAISPEDPDILANLCAIETAFGRNQKAIYWAKKCLKVDPGNEDALYNSALAYLSLGQYEEGWKRYDVSLGNKYRQERYFDAERKLPRWDGGEVDGDIVVYGEQGLGDEIMFASMIPDAMKAGHIILECDRRLRNLFKRSFPDLTVYPTRWDDEIKWHQNHWIRAKCDAGHLGTLFRPTAESFPRKPYLVADPERRAAYRGLLSQFKGKKVGIAWNGGRVRHDQQTRHIPLHDLMPLFKTADVDWIDLEYKDRSLEISRFFNETGVPINHYPWITLEQDYDNTAALVAELDMVIATSTTVAELAGALGVPCIQITPNVPTWRVGSSGERHPFYGGVTVLRKEGDSWTSAIERARQCMLSSFANQAVTTAQAKS